MDKYSVPKLIEKKISLPFNEFRDALRHEYHNVSKGYKPDTIKDKDLKFGIESYLKILNLTTYFLDTELLQQHPVCDKKISGILKSSIIHYVQIGDLPDTCLQAF